MKNLQTPSLGGPMWQVNTVGSEYSSLWINTTVAELGGAQNILTRLEATTRRIFDNQMIKRKFDEWHV